MTNIFILYYSGTEQKEKPTEETKVEEGKTEAETIKTENDSEPKEPTAAANIETVKDSAAPRFEFLNDVACFHSSALQKLKERKNLLSNIGPFRRALCARRDLEMRRQLCKVDKVKGVLSLTHCMLGYKIATLKRSSASV